MIVSRFNGHFANHFSSCLLLARAHDPYRQREVQLRLLPGEFDYVGITDGTDAWIAPVAGDPFSVGIKRILDELRQGKMPTVPAALVRRERKQLVAPVLEQAPVGRVRRQLLKAS